MATLCGSYVSNGNDLFKVVDTFVGDKLCGPQVFIENAADGSYTWIPLNIFVKMIKVHPD